MAIPSFEELKEAAREGTAPRHAYDAQSDEPLGWDTSGVVRLDVAIYAVHLYTARLSFRSIARLCRIRTLALAAQISASAALFFGKRAVSKHLFVQLLVEFIGALVLTAARTKWEAEIEQAIRRNSIIAQREVRRLILKASTKRKRSTDYVLSRHETPRQRKPNKSWKKKRKLRA